MRTWLSILLVTALGVGACTSTKRIALLPVGDWEYSIRDTPEGDFAGIMTVTRSEDQYHAKLNNNGSDLPFEKFSWEGTSKSVSGELYYAGTLVLFSAALNGDEMLGTMAAGGMEFPFKASRKK